MSKIKNRKFRIFHGPVNIGGIGRYLADWQRKQGAIADFIVFQDQTMRQNHHLDLRLSEYPRLRSFFIRLGFFLFCLFKYDVFHFYYAKSLLWRNLDLPILKLFGKRVVMTYCGSDVRLIELEKQHNPYHHLLKIGSDHPKFDASKKKMIKRQNRWVDAFIAPRNTYLPTATQVPEQKIHAIWIHNTMDMQAYTPSQFRQKKIPLIVHAPSEMGIKGTEYVERAINALREQNVQFEYRRLHGLPNVEVQRILREEADIVLDQFLVGGFGSLAVEAMYYGKPVMGYIIDSIKDQHYPDCPVSSATIDTLEERLLDLINDVSARERLGREGRAFVEKYLDREKVNQELWQVYQSLYLPAAHSPRL
ncbi:MAG: glycosyltransferase [Pseudomonadales bacterium]|nr:glycosyltransferase [Pseudomonadales bacterium]